jgi:hypothetical protein
LPWAQISTTATTSPDRLNDREPTDHAVGLADAERSTRFGVVEPDAAADATAHERPPAHAEVFLDDGAPL